MWVLTVFAEEQLIGDLVCREVGRQVAQDAGLAVGELFIQAPAAGPSRLAAGRRRGPGGPGGQVQDLGDQGEVSGTVPAMALEQRRGSSQGERQEYAVGFGDIQRPLQDRSTGALVTRTSPSASRDRVPDP
jgi:hypothetical protein